MIGIVLDSVLMLLLVAALGYGVRLEKKLTALRAGQLAFAGAVTELNQAAGRAESALISLRQSGEEADMLHDRLMKAREVKTQLEMLIARAPVSVPQAATPVAAAPEPLRIEPVARPIVAAPRPVIAPVTTPDDDRALRMAALAERIHGISKPEAAAPGRDNVAAILGALTANQAAKQSLNQARRSLDEDLFAA
ncbi:hypothetical protein BH10PSE1_BH10PSE1_07640 [soil metagenome]